MAIQQFPLPAAAGIPSGDTAGRPAAPVIGDTYYNGELGLLEIYTGNDWVPSSAIPGMPTITVVDVGTSAAFGSAQGTITITPPTNGGLPSNYFISSSTGGYTATTTGTTATITVGDNGSYTFSAIAFNDFGNGITGPTTTGTLTTVPATPTIGTATTTAASTTVTVNWTLNSNGGKNRTSITITPFLNGTTAQTSQTAATTTATSHGFTGLTSGSAYTFKVKTANDNGDSIESIASNSLTIPTIITANFLVVGGGGSGGTGTDPSGGGGGGAGGYRTSDGTSGGGGSAESALSLTQSANFTVTVGAGGSASVLSSINAAAGGPGGSNGGAGGSGGSGGGGSRSGSGGTGTANQGFGGGSGFTSKSGGGGGSGNVGTSASNVSNGPGGNGVTSNLTGSAIIRGGGGGGSGNAGQNGNGGNGGGGGGGTFSGTAGNANTGGGGGGGSNAGGAGGSGIVIIKYANTFAANVGGGLTSTENTSGGFKIRTFTAGTGTVSIG